MRYQLPSIIRTKYFQPRKEDMPQGGMPYWFPFDWNPLATMDVQELTRTIHQDVLLYAMTGTVTNKSLASVDVFSQIYHIHNGVQLPLFSKPSPMGVAFGSGQKPMPLLPTYFVPAGDQIQLEVRSQDRLNNLKVEATLFGTGINYSRLTRLQKAVLDDKKRFLDSDQSDLKDLIGDQAPQTAAPLVRTSTQNFPYPAPGAAAQTIFSYQVPPGQRARIFEHALVHAGGAPPDMTGNVIWRFLVNGWPLKGLGSQIAQIGSFQTPDRVVIWLTENDLFQVTVETPAAGQQQNGATAYRIAGWTAPIRSSS